MGRVLKRLLGVVFSSPVMLIALAWALLMTAASLAITVALPMVFWEIVQDVMKTGLTVGDAGMMLFMVAFLIGGAAFTYWVTLVSVTAVWDMGKGFVEDVQDMAAATREVLGGRAERAEAQGGMLSVSVGDGSGGELSQVSPANDGLELVDEGATLDLAEQARGV